MFYVRQIRSMSNALFLSLALHHSFQVLALYNVFNCADQEASQSMLMQRESSSTRRLTIVQCPLPDVQGQSCMFYLTSEMSAGSDGRDAGSRGTGDVASMRAGFKMIGRVMGGTPTCSGEAKGCRIRGDWVRVGGESDVLLTGVGIGGVEGGTGDNLSFPVRVRKKITDKAGNIMCIHCLVNMPGGSVCMQ